MEQNDPELAQARRVTVALDNSVENLEDEQEVLEDENEFLQEQVDRLAVAFVNLNRLAVAL